MVLLQKRDLLAMKKLEQQQKNAAIHSPKDFRRLVAIALKELPETAKIRMNNVAVCVQANPSARQLSETGTRRGDLLLGLYEGIPETEWGKGFGNLLPDKITIFQRNIERVARTQKEIAREVRRTVRHEIAHHFGFAEEELV